jgi:dipeptidyl aminopeptidase/acylaminoacyl peptidase
LEGRLALEALVLLPKDRKPGPLPTIVDIHGGPTWSAKHAFNPGFALHEVAADYAVFLPNYRGNTGWGQPYSRLNIGDPGGAEWDDIMAGIDHCIAEGFADADKLGVTGASYGGYLTGWAVARTNRFKAAVMVSGISNQWS